MISTLIVKPKQWKLLMSGHEQRTRDPHDQTMPLIAIEGER
jgi:hypothetical protein